MQAENWMQAVRNGLWPPCFSFQMLTACSHEVSLIDDDNTFLSGLLGVYGRFVLTSQDIISLMHPHWGATLLQISLSNIKDILFVREVEVSSAGVFSIIFKREDLKVKALHFFCKTAKDAIQWILNKLHAREIDVKKNASKSEESIPQKAAMSKSNKLINCKNEMKFSNSKPFLLTRNSTDADHNAVDSVSKNLQYVKQGADPQADAFPGINVNFLNCVESESVIVNSAKVEEHQNFVLDRSKKNDTHEHIENTNVPEGPENSPPSIKLNDNIYANIGHDVESATMKSSTFSMSDTGNEYENIKMSTGQIIFRDVIKSVSSNDASNSVIHSFINKCNTLTNSDSTNSEAKSSTYQLTINTECITKTNKQAVKKSSDKCVNSNKICENKEKNSTQNTTITSSNIINDNTEVSNVKSNLYVKTTYDSQQNSHSHMYGTVSKSAGKDSQEKMQKLRLPINESLIDNRNSAADTSCLLPSFPSDFLNTSMNSERLKYELTRGSTSSEDDTETFTWMLDEFHDLNFPEQVYEDILSGRKGTVYEKIDSSDDDDEYATHLPPELPRRPEKLDIPESLRLQKLSKSINQTLKVMESAPTKEYPQLKFVKKIKDVSRIMQISPNSEKAAKPFVIETKLSANSKNISVLRPESAN